MILVELAILTALVFCLYRIRERRRIQAVDREVERLMDLNFRKNCIEQLRMDQERARLRRELLASYGISPALHTQIKNPENAATRSSIEKEGK